MERKYEDVCKSLKVICDEDVLVDILKETTEYLSIESELAEENTTNEIGVSPDFFNVDVSVEVSKPVEIFADGTSLILFVDGKYIFEGTREEIAGVLKEYSSLVHFIAKCQYAYGSEPEHQTFDGRDYVTGYHYRNLGDTSFNYDMDDIDLTLSEVFLKLELEKDPEKSKKVDAA